MKIEICNENTLRAKYVKDLLEKKTGKKFKFRYSGKCVEIIPMTELTEEEKKIVKRIADEKPEPITVISVKFGRPPIQITDVRDVVGVEPVTMWVLPTGMEFMFDKKLSKRQIKRLLNLIKEYLTIKVEVKIKNDESGVQG